MGDNKFERIIENFKDIFTDIPMESKERLFVANIKMLVEDPIDYNSLNNYFSVSSNIIQLIIREKLINPNVILSALIEYTSNYAGLFLIGMVIRKGANPNVYIIHPPYGNLHVLCALSLRNKGLTDPYFRYIVMLMRELNSNINYPALNFRKYDTSDLDINYVEKVAEEAEGGEELKMSVKQFIREQGKLPDEDYIEFLDSISDDELMQFTVALDSTELFNHVAEQEFFKEIFDTGERSTTAVLKLFIDISTASALTIANEITDKIIPKVDSETINTQRIPIYAAVSSGDVELFNLLAQKGSSIKYISITQLIAEYKKWKRMKLKIYKNNFWMLLDAVNVGADIDIYQFDLFTSAADYEEIEELKKAYDVPKWKKLCAIASEKPRVEIKQIAFELNIPYEDRSEKEICNKLKQISLMDKNQFLEAAVMRQEDRISADLSTITDFTPGGKKPQSRCSKKSTIIQNPYAYNDTRMAFYYDPKGAEDEQVWCFTADTFSNLIATRTNPYTGRELPDKFVETLKAQVNILKDMGLFNFNNSIKDTLKEYFTRGTINNKKTDYAYNTVVKCLSLYGLSEEKLNGLSEITLGETILNEICDVKLAFFDQLTPKHQVITTTRVIYSLSKGMKEPGEFFQTIVRSVIGNMDDLSFKEEDNKDEENAISNYMGMLE